MGLHFSAVASMMLCRTYIDLLFLSTYPKSWLPYYFMGQTLVILLLAYFITPMISKGSRLRTATHLFCSALTIVASIILLQFNIEHFPFLLSLWLAAFAVLLGVVSWNCVGDAFDPRTFKKIILWINVSGSLGGLMVGLLIPTLISLFSSEMLLYLLTVFTMAQAVLVYQLHPLPASGKKTKGGQSPIKYPLFKNLAVGVFLLFMVDTFADYALKAEVGAAFDKEGIASFMGPFYGMSSVLTLVVQLAGTNVLIKYCGIVGLLAILPGFCLLVNAGMLYAPGLWLAAIFRMGETVFRYSIDNIGRELAANPLPSPIRKSGKLFLKGTITPLGTGAGALVLWLAAEPLGLRGVAVMSILISVVWLFCIKKTKRSYLSSLEDLVRQKRFIETSGNASDSSTESALDVAFHALREKDINTVLFGLMLLENVRLDKMPQVILDHLNSESPEIRALVAKLAFHIKDAELIPLLVKQLEVEKDPDVLWKILEAISVFDPAEALPHAENLMDSPLAEVRASAILILITAGNLELLQRGTAILREMVYSDDPLMRKGAARALAVLKSGKLGTDLRALIHDPNEDVAVTTIRTASFRQSICLVEDIASKLGKGRVSYYAGRALSELGTPAVPYLLKIMRKGKERETRAAIRALAAIPGAEVDSVLIDIASSERVLTRNVVARESALRASRLMTTEDFKKKALRFVEVESHAIGVLKAGSVESSFSDFARAEMDCRMELAASRLLYWFAICTKPAEVLDVMPVVLSRDTSREALLRRATALELLETLSKNKCLKKAVAILEKKSSANGSPGNISEALHDLRDPWLKRVLSTEFQEYKGGEMNVAQKVVVLKKVKLFNQLPGEILMTIAEECQSRDMIKGEKVVSKGDLADGLYIVVSGTMKVFKNGQLVNHLKEHDFFGEVGLLDDSVRLADVISDDDGVLLFMGKETFQAITDDLPEVMRMVVKTIIGYLKMQTNDK